MSSELERGVVDLLELSAAYDHRASDPSAEWRALPSVGIEERLHEDRSRHNDKPMTSNKAHVVSCQLYDGVIEIGRSSAHTKRPPRSTLWVLVLSMIPVSAWADTICPAPPPYALLRQDEGYSYLRDVACRRDTLWTPSSSFPWELRTTST
jgi:hypothetical protein